jgi:DNA polymerase-1
MLVAFDERNSETYRHQYDFYKAGRAKQPDDLYSQIPLVKQFLELYGIK